jgi:hypothetical protein
MSGMAPAGSMNASQPSEVVPAPSFTTTNDPETPASVGAGPKAAVAASYVPAAEEGGSTTTAGRPPVGALSLLWSVYAWTLLPRAVVNSAPPAPSVSCQPNGEAVASAGFSSSVRGPSFGLSLGRANTR